MPDCAAHARNTTFDEIILTEVVEQKVWKQSFVTAENEEL